MTDDNKSTNPPTCPRCGEPLEDHELRSLWAHRNRAKAGPVDPVKAHERARTAAKARWYKVQKKKGN